MAVKIISENEPIHVTSLIAYIYADPGVGKTSLGFTTKKPVLLDFDGGAHRTGKLRLGKTIKAERWSDVADIEQSDLEAFETIIIDTAGNMLESIKTHLARTASNKQGDGSLTIKAHGVAGEMFRSFLARLRSYGKDIVLVAHATEDKKKDNVIIRPDVGGKNQGLLYRQADMMAYFTNVEGKEGRSLKVLDFVPNTSHHAKNSGGLGTIEVPDLFEHKTFMGDLIQRAKDHINSLTDAQVKDLSDADDLENWKNDCEHCQNAQDLNALIVRLDKDHSRYRLMRTALTTAAGELDVTFDKGNGTYVDNNFVDPLPEQKPAPASAETKKTAKTPSDGAKLAMHAVRDAIIADMAKATTDAEFDAIEERIFVLSMDDRDYCFDALEQCKVALEGNTQDFNAPIIDPNAMINDDIPSVIITEETLADDLDRAGSVAEVDQVIHRIETHDNKVERARLLKSASSKRRTLIKQQEHAA